MIAADPFVDLSFHISGTQLGLAGKSLEIGGAKVQIGVPEIRGLIPATALRSRLVRRAAKWFLPGGRGSCRTNAKLGRSLVLPYKSQAGRFQSAARLISKSC